MKLACLSHPSLPTALYTIPFYTLYPIPYTLYSILYTVMLCYIRLCLLPVAWGV